MIVQWRKIKQRWEIRSIAHGRCVTDILLSSMIIKGLTEKMSFEQRNEGDEGVWNEDACKVEGRDSGRGTCECNDFEGEM